MAPAHQQGGSHRRLRPRVPLLLALAVAAGALVGSSHAWVRPPLQPQPPLAVGGGSSSRSHAARARRAAAAAAAATASMPLLNGQALGRRTPAVAMAAAAGAEGAEGGAASYDVDVAIIGGGPAGSVMAALLAEQHQLRVVLMDPKLEQRWIPNYGVWLEEWQGLCAGVCDG